MLLLLLAFLLSGGLLLRDLVRSGQERAANEALVRQVTNSAKEQQTDTSPAGEDEQVQAGSAEPERDYSPLLRENGDLAAWLTIGGIDVDYPVMFTPEDPDHYLRLGFNGSYALSGSLFIGEDCTPDGGHVIIYGHNMSDGSMFGNLARYADEDFARANPELTYDVIRPDGGYDRLTLRVVAAFYSRVYPPDEQDAFRYYNYTELSDPEIFQEYVEQVMSASLYDLGEVPHYGDRLLTLSTCSYHTAQGRFVVVARTSSETAEGAKQ